MAAAEFGSGEALESLVDDPCPLIRQSLAAKGIRIDLLITDRVSAVRDRAREYFDSEHKRLQSVVDAAEADLKKHEALLTTKVQYND